MPKAPPKPGLVITPPALNHKKPGNASVWLFWHQFELPKCQVHWGIAAIHVNVHFGGLSLYFLHFAPKTSQRTIDDPYDLAFAHLMMFSHTTIPHFVYACRAPASAAKPHIAAYRRVEILLLYGCQISAKSDLIHCFKTKKEGLAVPPL